MRYITYSSQKLEYAIPMTIQVYARSMTIQVYVIEIELILKNITNYCVMIDKVRYEFISLLKALKTFFEIFHIFHVSNKM